MARTDQLEPRDPPESIETVDASADLFLSGLEQAFNLEDQKSMEATIRRLREHPTSLEFASRLYESRPDDSAFRWGVVYLASMVGAAGTASWLTRVALETLPDAIREIDGCETQRDNEVLVRVMATEGLGLLVPMEDPDVISDALVSIATSQSDPAIRSAAVVQLMKLDFDSRRLREVLSKDAAHLADVRLLTEPAQADERPKSLGLDPGESPLPPEAPQTGA